MFFENDDMIKNIIRRVITKMKKKEPVMLLVLSSVSGLPIIC